MRLKKFVVTGLFGLFDHEIPLRLEDRITIIHAPNGYGKTVILKLISNFFGGTLLIYRQVEFEKIQLEFDDGSIATITQRTPERKKSVPPSSLALYAISYKDAKGKNHKFDPWADSPANTEAERFAFAELPRLIDRYVPHVARIAHDQFRDMRTGEIIPLYDAFEKFWQYLPDSAKAKLPHPPWLEELRRSVHCRLIETQRLMVSLKEKSPAGREESALIPTVTTDSADLVARIGRSLAESATLSQSLDRTFPKRLLSESANSLPEKELRERLASLEQRRARLTNVGLLEKSDESALIPEKTFTAITERVLTEYVDDAEKKLTVFDSLLARIELLAQIINKRFQFKTLSVTGSDGFVLTDIRNRKVDLENLSSGEQHELVLVYDLLFSTKQDTLLLIDEPEISLHIAWQKKFLDDLRRIIELTPMDIVLSTHSPQLIGSNLDLAIQLRGPRDGKQPL
jgi:predicted ATP-binding protein involved in virulence